MTDRRIAVLYKQSLLAQGVETLLKRIKGLDVMAISLDPLDVARRVAQFHPEAVIVDADEIRNLGGTLILQVLREAPTAKVFCINLNGSNVDIYHRQQLVVNKADELVEAITRG
ncbi:MAG: hypothetical protein HY675_11765 [Chloroflexi bacterium]|nr:hypothetical protein [Chloroflexota bacterium]